MISMEAEIPPTTTIKERIFKDRKQNEEQNTAPREYLKLVYHVDPIRSRFLFPIFTPFSTNYPRDRQATDDDFSLLFLPPLLSS